MKNTQKITQKILFLTLNIWLLNTLPSFSQSNSNPIINRPILQIGSQGNTVLELQAVLKFLGYYQGPINGQYSDELKLAVINFQKAANIPTTGITDNLTWDTLLPLNPPNNTTITNNKPPQNTNNSQNNTTITNNKPPENTNNSQNNNTITNSKPPENTNRNPQLLAANMPLLKEGMSGENVKILQQRLKALGFFSGTIDGIFGVQTLAAVIEAQGKFNLGADGIVGFQTWKALLGQ